MTSGMLSYRFGLAILSFLLFAGSSVGLQEVITTISGRHVPIDLVQEHFVKKLSSSANESILYELTDHVLRGPDLFLDLRSDLLPVQAEHTPASATVILNGVNKEFSPKTLKTFRVKSYSVIVDDETDQVLAVTGNGVVLAPLHRSQFPGILVNKMALSDPYFDLASDLKILGREHGPSVSRDISPGAVGKDVQVLRRVMENINSVSVTTRQAGGSCASGTTYYLEIAVAYDNTFCALYDNEENVATKALQEVVDKANEAYASNTCIQLVLVHVEAHCNDQNDPYSGFSRFSPSQILNSFQQIWIESRGNIERDAAYLITGFQDGSSVAGVAYIGAACSTRNGYGWVEGPSAVIFAHEVGHTLGGQHTSSGIMGAVATGQVGSFSADSVQQFNNFVDNFGGSACMGLSKPSGAPKGTSPPATSPPTTTRAEPTLPAASPNPTSPDPPSPDPPSPTSGPLPNEPPTGRGETCKSGFTKSMALSCSIRRLRLITFSDGSVVFGKFKTSVQQRNGEFIVRFRTTKQLYISKYRDLVTTDRRLVGSAGTGDYKTVTGSAKAVDSAWKADDMPNRSGETTCCGKDLFIEADVSVCIMTSSGMELCQTISETYTTRIACNDACGGNPSGTFSAMSADQECPSCT